MGGFLGSVTLASLYEGGLFVRRDMNGINESIRDERYSGVIQRNIGGKGNTLLSMIKV